MLKLQELLNRQVSLTKEVEALETFFAHTEVGDMHIQCGGVTISFEAKDGGARSKVLSTLEQEYYTISEELDEVNAKLAALEKLA